ncbi:uncharacterized protein V1518DRAFT_415583 [Limtongia smithiae]|uniref:uncharacterized protein n=1 Tax=Limtongia smithiae TaxID=1125753 RepID=UPI0034CE6FA6
MDHAMTSQSETTPIQCDSMPSVASSMRVLRHQAALIVALRVVQFSLALTTLGLSASATTTAVNTPTLQHSDVYIVVISVAAMIVSLGGLLYKLCVSAEKMAVKTAADSTRFILYSMLTQSAFAVLWLAAFGASANRVVMPVPCVGRQHTPSSTEDGADDDTNDVIALVEWFNDNPCAREVALMGCCVAATIVWSGCALVLATLIRIRGGMEAKEGGIKEEKEERAV